MANYNIQNILDKGLDKHYSVTVSYSDMEAHIDNKIVELQKTYKLDGFRPGKVPVSVIKEKHEMALLSEASEKVVNEALQKIMKDNDLRLAVQPNVEIKKLSKNEDFEFVILFEIFPEVPDVKLDKISLEEEAVKITDEDIKEALERISNDNKNLKPQDASYKAKIGDTVKIDFLGKIKDVPFEGGESKDYMLELGSKSFIEGFEDQLVGTKAGDKKVVKVKFPKNYHQHLAGKNAEFDVTVHEVLSGEKPELTDEFVKERIGLESLQQLKDNIKAQLVEMYTNTTREILKDDLVMILQKELNFEIPKGLSEEQFKNLWKTEEENFKRDPELAKDEKAKKKLEAETRKEAEKMVRVGLYFTEYGRKNNIQLTNDEITAEMNRRAAYYPGQERAFVEYYQKNPQAMEQLTGVLLENKVINDILSKVKVKTKEYTTKDFQKRQEKRKK